MNMPENRSQQIIITIDLTKDKSQQVTVKDNTGFMGDQISHEELEQIANDRNRGLRWRLSVVEFPGSECWVVQTPGGERVFCS
jgi:hypothetical protein